MEIQHNQSAAASRYGLEQYGFEGLLSSSADRAWSGLSAQLCTTVRKGVIPWRTPQSDIRICVDTHGNKTAETVSDLASVVHNLVMDVRDSYRPELHYMRGPGPKWRAKHQPWLRFDSEAAGQHELSPARGGICVHLGRALHAQEASRSRPRLAWRTSFRNALAKRDRGSASDHSI